LDYPIKDPALHPPTDGGATNAGIYCHQTAHIEGGHYDS
jgi:hypothetical protein